MTRSFAFLFLALVASLWTGRIGYAGDYSASSIHKVVFGLVLHDRGPTSDQHESGVDPNLEFQFTPPDWKFWRWIGSPYAMAGATPNFNGNTSVVYGGIADEFSLSDRVADESTAVPMTNWFVSVGLSAALHDGPLHKDEVGCREDSDCGFGYRILPRVNIELGGYFGKAHGLSLFYDHMSHKFVLPGENEGIDHIGIRYHYRFSN